MIDTLMVVWTSGMWKRLLRNTSAFLLLFLGICALLFLIMTSGKQWPGLAVTVARSNSSTQSNALAFPASSTATAQPAPTAYSTAQPFIQPIVLQNPILPRAHSRQNSHKHPIHHAALSPAYNPPPAQSTNPNPPSNSGSYDPTNPLQNLP